MNMNWLGFSLSPREDDAPISHQLADQDTFASRLGFNSNDQIQGAGGGNHVSGAGSSQCFDLTNSDSTASLNHDLPPSNFGILAAAAFNRNNNHIYSQDWNMKGVGMNSSDSNNYKRTSSSSDLSTMLMGSSTTSTSCSIISQPNLENHHQQQLPKLENFLGRHSFADHDRSSTSHDYMFDMNNGPGAISSNVMNTSNTNSNNIGLSMIKTWLRNQPPQPRDNNHQLEQESKNTKESRNQPQSSLSLSMSTGSLHTVTTAGGAGSSAGAGETTSSSNNNTKQSPVATATTTDPQTQTTGGAIEAVPRKAIDTFGQRTSIYRGVTRHRWTGRYEAHLWDNSCRREGQTRKGRQVYLGGYDKEDKAARAYDLAALKYWGTTTTTNFPISTYEKEIDEMKPMTRQEYVASLRRKSSGFSRGASIYRGVTRHHQHGRWQARIGRVAGNKDLYLGTFSTQEEAAEAYDIAAIKFRGLNAVTNFDMSRYDVKSILESSALPITTGDSAKRLKDVQQQPPPPADHHHQIRLSSVLDHHGQMIRSSSSTEHDIMGNVYSAYGSYGSQQGCSWPTLAFNQSQAQAAAPPPHQAPFAAGINGMQLHYSPYGYGYGNAHAQRVWCKQEQDTNSNYESSFHQDDDHLRQQLQMGGTHNFFHDHDHQQRSGLMGLMDSSAAAAASMEHSSGSNSVIYSVGDHHGNNNGYGSSGRGTVSGYIMPMAMSTVVANDGQNQADGNNDNNINGFGDGDGDDQEVNIKGHQLGYDHHQNVFLGSSNTTDPAYQHHASNRNLYYQLPVHDDQHEASSEAVATSSTTCNMNWVPTAVPTSHFAHPTFTVWNNTELEYYVPCRE